ncbi:MAG: serine hydrolase [Lachnospiraceae bacterium]|nr:serine hydrolase [Lachnospiraceae bacterium]
MKGFRDLDPGEAEQVFSNRRRRKEYIADLEAQLYESFMTGYDANPSEDAPSQARGRRPGRDAAPEEPRRQTYDEDEQYGRHRRQTHEEDEQYARPRRQVYDEDEQYGRPRRQTREEDEQYGRPRRQVYEEGWYRAPYRRRPEEDDAYEESDEQEAYEERADRPFRRTIGVYGRRQEPFEEYDGEDSDEFYEVDEEEDAGDQLTLSEDYGEYRRPVRRSRRSRRIRIMIRRAAVLALAVLLITGVVFGIAGIRKSRRPQTTEHSDGAKQGGGADDLEELAGEQAIIWNDENASEEEEPQPEEPESVYLAPSEEKAAFFEGYTPKWTDQTEQITDEEIQSSYAVLINAATGEIIAEREADAITSPASMTKILTLLVAAEHLKDPDETVVMTQEVGDLVYRKDLSAVGYQVGDVIPVKDLLYGTILPSGADAALLLADHIAGSEAAFVTMMNDKAAELGISETAHFTNPVGIYDPDNHCTMKDMAMILKAAVENQLCREVLSAHTYTTAPTDAKPEGIELSNWFLRRIEDKDTHGEVICAKTGFVDQSGCCAASYQISNDGGRYLCVTGNAWSSWRAIYDHVGIYDLYTN